MQVVNVALLETMVGCVKHLVNRISALEYALRDDPASKTVVIGNLRTLKLNLESLNHDAKTVLERSTPGLLSLLSLEEQEAKRVTTTRTYMSDVSEKMFELGTILNSSTIDIGSANAFWDEAKSIRLTIEEKIRDLQFAMSDSVESVYTTLTDHLSQLHLILMKIDVAAYRNDMEILRPELVNDIFPKFKNAVDIIQRTLPVLLRPDKDFNLAMAALKAVLWEVRKEVESASIELHKVTESRWVLLGMHARQEIRRLKNRIAYTYNQTLSYHFYSE